MKTRQTVDFDPYLVLGVDADAGDEQIRAAYLARLKQYPPDRSPVEFERVRDAYDLLRDRRRRAEHTLFSINPDQSLEMLLDGGKGRRRFLGPAPWLAVLRRR